MANIPTLEGLTHVVIHHTAGPRNQTYEEIERHHVTPISQGGRGFLAIAYHVVIMPDGTLRYGRRLPLQGAHAERWNDRTIGVCLVGDNTKAGQEWTTEQLRSARRYLDGLQLIVPGLLVVGHRDTKPTLCPGLERPALLRALGRANE